VTDRLRKIYEAEGLLRRYFDQATPCDLFRGQKRADARLGLPILSPNPGYTRRDGSVQLPDVLIEQRDGQTFVLGCRSPRGNFRGVSLFDQPNPDLASFSWFKLPKQTEIPEALAITQDGESAYLPNHFTIAPKDDMPLALFLVWLNALGTKMARVL